MQDFDFSPWFYAAADSLLCAEGRQEEILPWRRRGKRRRRRRRRRRL